jgi:hypothetical protein
MTEILLLLLFNIKHFLVDFVWQTDKQAEEKSQYLKLGGLEHSGLHALFTYLILIHFIDIQPALMLAAVDFVLHYHIDWAKMNINKRYGYTPADKPFWFWLGFDQFLHQLTYICIAILTIILIGDYV